MIVIDEHLKRRARESEPIRVALVGTGFMGFGVLNQLVRHTPGVAVVAVYNRTLDKALSACQRAGLEACEAVATAAQAEGARAAGRCIVTDQLAQVLDAPDVDVVLEATGAIDFGLSVVEAAFAAGRHVLTLNAELLATLGPILHVMAQEAEVGLALADGDQPAVTLNLYRWVVGMGFTPRVCGNIKGFQNRARNPDTQRAFAAQWGMTPEMVTSFADGTKIAMEQACIANATGMGVACRGMHGFEASGHVDALMERFDLDALRRLGGIVDYVIGPEPGPGVFIYAEAGDAHQAAYMPYMKRGEGPLYCFYVPYHLLYLEIGASVARLVDFGDAIVAPLGAPVVEVVAAAKVDLPAGAALDGLGGFQHYGLAENASVVAREGLLPAGLAQGGLLKRPVPQGTCLRWDDVEFADTTRARALYARQQAHFSAAPTPARPSGGPA